MLQYYWSFSNALKLDKIKTEIYASSKTDQRTKNDTTKAMLLTNISFIYPKYSGIFIQNTRASRWRAIAYPRASAIKYLRAHYNSQCVPPVLINRAIICDSFKVLAQKAYEELCDNKNTPPKKKKKTTQKSYLLTSSDPQTNTVFYSLPLTLHQGVK